MWAVHSVDAPDALFGNAQCGGEIEVNNRGCALEVEAFVHGVGAQRDCRCGRCEREEFLDAFAAFGVCAGCNDHVGAGSGNERFELGEGDEVVVEREDAVVACCEFDEHVGFALLACV